MVTNFTYLLWIIIIINYLNPYNCAQQMAIIKYKWLLEIIYIIIIIIRYNCVQIINIR